MTIRDRAITEPTFTTVGDLKTLTAAITQAGASGRQVRVRGAMHSVRSSILTDGSTGTNLVLGGDFTTVQALNPSPGGLIRAGGGCRIGGDPDEGVPYEQGFLAWLANRKPDGQSLIDLGGITHQSIGGFLSTGSSGGSLRYAMERQIQRIVLVDGTGTVRTIDRYQQPDDFAAVGVSMGLFGVIVGVDFTPAPRFAITGKESTTTVADGPFQLYQDGPGGLADYLRNQDYCRIMWWPQPKVQKLVTWTATRQDLTSGFVPNPYREMGDPDADPATGYPKALWEDLLPKLVATVVLHAFALGELAFKYRDSIPSAMGEFLARTLDAIVTEGVEGLRKVLETAGVSEVMQFGVDLYFTLLGNRQHNDLARALFTGIFDSEAAWEGTWSPLIMNGIFLVDDVQKKVPLPQRFQDYGETGLPMDDQISDMLMPTEFTELWLPIDQTAKVMGLLRDHYAAGYAATGTYACELYATAATPFWMSPAYNGDVVRVDLFWFARNGDQTATEFYTPFWDLLRKANVPFRPHWGKYLPPAQTYGPDYYRSVYPKFDDFLAMRATYDPKQVFVTDYWRSQLGIPRPGQARGHRAG